MSDTEPRSNRRRDRATLPIILIAAGVLLLLSRLGLFDWGFALGVLNLWPLLLIAAGVDVLTQGRYRLVVVLATVAIGALLWRAPGWLPGSAGPAETHAIAYELDGAEAAKISLSHGVGRLSLGALEAGSPLAIGGTIDTGRGERLDAAHRIDDGVAEVTVRTRQQGPSFNVSGRERAWDLELTRAVPVDLSIDSGVGESVLELREIVLRALDLDAGVGEIHVTLPSTGGYRGEIDAGVGAVVVRIPRSVEARLEVDTGLGGADVRGTWTRDGDRYLSSGWDEAPDDRRIDLRISGGVGEITVERVD